MSNKLGMAPLASDSISGALIDEIIKDINEDCIKTNLVDFAPLDKNNKLRYPNQIEKDLGFISLNKTIERNNPCLIVCLGNEVYEYLGKKFINSIKIKHPSYIAVYRRKFREEYITETSILINSLIIKDFDI